MNQDQAERAIALLERIAVALELQNRTPQAGYVADPIQYATGTGKP